MVRLSALVAVTALVARVPADDKPPPGGDTSKRGIELAGKDADWEYRAALAAAYAEVGDFELAVAEQRKVLEDKSLDAEARKKMEARLERYRAKKPFRDDE